MNLQKLIDACRIALSDTAGSVSSKKLSEEMAKLFLNEAEQEACRRARLITDSSTAAICDLSIVANTSTYSTDPRIIKVRRVKWSGADKPLRRISHRDLDADVPGWESHTGQVTGYIRDMGRDKIRLYRTPTANGTIKMTVVRLPLNDMSGLLDTPEIPPHLHIKLVLWVVYRMRSIEDSELYDPRKAVLALGEFEKEFGPASTALQEAFDLTQDYGEFDGDW